MPSPKKGREPKIKVKGNKQAKTKIGEPHPPNLQKIVSTPSVPVSQNTDGTRTHLTCELCGFEPTAKNRHQSRQDHLMRAHFMDKVEAAFPDMKTRHCPFPGCNFIGKDKQYILRHYVVHHKFNDKWLTEALAQRGIKYNPVHYRARPGEPRKKKNPRLAFVINKPNMSETYTCEKCHKKFDERCHLIAHNRHIHLKYGDDERKRMDAHRCEICGKMFVDVKYVQVHKNNVHLKIKNVVCDICDKCFTSTDGLRRHKKQVHFQPQAASQTSLPQPPLQNAISSPAVSPINSSVPVHFTSFPAASTSNGIAASTQPKSAAI